jgi:D-proline reductase (dithiol) PrdB
MPALHALATLYQKPVEWFLSEDPGSYDTGSADPRKALDPGANEALDEWIQLSAYRKAPESGLRPAVAGPQEKLVLVEERSVASRRYERQRFQQWIERLQMTHPEMEDVRNDDVAWTSISKPLSDSCVALVTTAGLHHRDRPPFDVTNPRCDAQFYEIDNESDSNDLVISHNRYSHLDADRDCNSIFPIDRLNELERSGLIGRSAPTSYSMMGFLPDPTTALAGIAGQIAENLKAQDVDLVLLSAGCPISHRTMVLLQGVIEAAGIATIAMTVEPHITSGVGSPRSVHVRYPAGNIFGEAGKPIQQRAILTAALEAASVIQKAGGVVELPYRWRRFPIIEQGKTLDTSDGRRHAPAAALGDGLDSLVRKAHAYQAFLEYRIAQNLATDQPAAGMHEDLARQIERIDDLVELLDTVAMDQLRPVLNAVDSLELRASGELF